MINGFATGDDSEAMTPAEHFRAAERSLGRTRGITEGSSAYTALTQNAIAHLLAIVVARLDPSRVTEPEVRLPGRVVVTAWQREDGTGMWGYIARDQGTDTLICKSARRWGTDIQALAAGAAYVGDLAGGDDAGAGVVPLGRRAGDGMRA